MELNRTRTISLGMALSAVLLVGGASAANASEGLPEVDVADIFISPDANLSDQAFLLDEAGTETPVAVTGNSKDSDAAVARSCAWYNMAIPVGGAWHTSLDGCSLIGTTDDAKHTYEFAVDPNSHSNACVSGRGYKKVGGSWEPVYQGVGCGTGGASTVTIGKVYTVGKIQAQSIGTTGSSIKWK